jgi:hypothetical protein
MMNKKEGNMKSAGDKPSHSGCSIYQGAFGPRLSTNIIPNTVKPL